jgi:glycosyltransferase involved in cell wall biosynthesis
MRLIYSSPHSLSFGLGIGTVSEGFGIVMLMRQFYPRTGGYQNQALRLATELRKNGFRVHVVTQRHGTLPPYEVHQGIPIHRVFAFRAGHMAAWSYLGSAFFWMMRNRGLFQIIHANRSSSGLVAGLIGFLLRKRVLYKLTRGDEVDAKGLRSGLLGRVKVGCLRLTVGKFVSLTTQTEADLLALGVSPQRVARIPNGIDLEDRLQLYDRDRIRAELSWGPEAKVVTFVGRLVHAKGVDWLLEIWKVVSQVEGRARLLIVGDGPDRPALTARAEALGIRDTVAFVGRQEDVYRFFAASDVFVLPSRLEGISNSLLEAMSQGLPVVAADDQLGGNRAVIADQGGILVPLGDAEAFAQSLLTLLRDQAFRTEMGRRARQKMAEAFSIESVTRRYLGIYHELLGPTCG